MRVNNILFLVCCHCLPLQRRIKISEEHQQESSSRRRHMRDYDSPSSKSTKPAASAAAAAGGLQIQTTSGSSFSDNSIERSVVKQFSIDMDCSEQR